MDGLASSARARTQRNASVGGGRGNGIFGAFFERKFLQFWQRVGGRAEMGNLNAPDVIHVGIPYWLSAPRGRYLTRWGLFLCGVRFRDDGSIFGDWRSGEAGSRRGGERGERGVYVVSR